MKNNILMFLIVVSSGTMGSYCYGQTTDTETKVYSDFHIHQGVLYTSGILGTDHKENIPAKFEEEVRQLFANLDKILHRANIRKEKIYSVTVFLSDIAKIDSFNELYRNYFHAPFPVRTCVGVEGLAKKARVEMSVLAIYDSQEKSG